MTLTGPARNVGDFYRTLSNEPLLTKAEIDRYYEPAIGVVRSDQNLVEQLVLKLRQAFAAERHFRVFVYGHSGGGKSTECTRLTLNLADRYQSVRLNVRTELDPAGAKPLDFLLLMLMRLAEAAKVLDGWTPPDRLVTGVRDWFAEHETQRSATRSIEGQASAGLGVDKKSMWAGLLGMFAQTRAELKLASLVKSESTDHELKRITSLVGVLNEFFDACNEHLGEQTPPRKWLLIAEDFEKLADRKIPEEIFVGQAGAIQQLRIAAIFSIPPALAYSKQGSSLPFSAYCLHDTPVHDRDHQPHAGGRDALRRMLAKRIDLQRFAPDQVERIVVASGGSPRDMFDLADEAATGALLAAPDAKPEDVVIRAEDVKGAISRQRRQTYLQLGEDPYESEIVTTKQKRERLTAIYRDHTQAGTPDPVLYSLLRGRLLREFNGDGWFGVPPLVVELLKELADLDTSAPGGLL